ncbi:MAG: hypothetical protein J6X55_13520 [Victivallales bacterium]|nr:hypothetical protein [Victivallales bacterium]
MLLDHQKAGDTLTINRIKRAVEELYGSYDALSKEIQQFIENVVQDGDYKKLYVLARQQEAENRNNLLEYQDEKPGVLSEDNVNDVLQALRRRKQKEPNE